MELKVAVVRDNRYLLHQPGLVHPERPERLEEIYKMLDADFGETLMTIQPELATLEQLELVHTPNYIRKVLKTSERAFTNLAPDTPVCSQSYLAAWLAVGGCIKGLQALLSGRCDVCFALIRPPGHHAAPDRAEGFCIFNNLGVTARYATMRHGFRRVLIIDWDIHHGNGIQDMFYDQKQVLYLSSHYRGWYPPTGDWHETGVGEGLGYTINLPLSKDVQDADMLYLYWKVLEPVVKRYRPELIFVSAGFDGHHSDPLGRIRLTERSFRGLTELLIEARASAGDPPILLALEGGYDCTALVSCVQEVLRTFISSNPKGNLYFPEAQHGAEIVKKARSIHKEYHVWTD
ncbi:MAG TPA: histone deacetylase [Desulfomonilaceae bacterium]|nr:histone deacetylase [Desulfomonilaceae bacterium]